MSSFPEFQLPSGKADASGTPVPNPFIDPGPRGPVLFAAPARVGAEEIARFLLRDILPAMRVAFDNRSVGNLVVIECPFDFAEAIGAVLAEEELLSFVEQRKVATGPDGQAVEQVTRVPAFFPIPWSQVAEQMQEEISGQILSLLASHKNCVMLARSIGQLPASLQALVRCRYAVRRFNRESFVEACQAFFDRIAINLELGMEDAAWVCHVTPLDLLINTAVKDEEIVAAIRESVQQRLSTLSDVRAGRPLSERSGLDCVKSWAAGIKETMAGGASAGWEIIGRGALLEGSDLVNKAEIARAVADACGLSFIATSTLNWKERHFSVDFQRARDHAPALLFIDAIDQLDIDARGGEEAEVVYIRKMMAPFVREMSQFDSAAPVIVVGGVGLGGSVNHALRQPGRLERVFAIPEPRASELTAEFQFLLGSLNIPHEVSAEEFERLGRYAQINDPRLIGLYVAHARRLAQAGGGVVTYAHLRDAMILDVREGESGIEKDAAGYERTAFHEAGHGALQLLLGKGRLNVEYMTIRPGPSYLGFMHPALESSIYRAKTYQDFVDEIHVRLGGRIAEEIRFGPTNVATGAGGGPGSDLYGATMTVLGMFCQYGMGAQPKPAQGSNLAVFPVKSVSEVMALPGMYQQVDGFLKVAYEDTHKEMVKHWKLVEALATALIARQVLDADEVQAIYREYLKEADPAPQRP